jgi:predicted nucleic-acid-binding Zn-ribbon protein
MSVTLLNARRVRFLVPCPKCGNKNVNAWGWSAEVVGRGSGHRFDADGGEIRGGVHVHREVLSATCDSCGHTWGPDADASEKLKRILSEAQKAAPEGAVYFYDSVWGWMLLQDGGRFSRAGDRQASTFTPKRVEEVCGIQFGFSS